MTDIKPLTKVEAERKKKVDAIRESCTAGIEAVLSNELVNESLELLDAVSACLFDWEHGDPANAIRSQVLRSAGSVAANLAEGIGKGYEDDKRRFFMQARGSAYETVVWLRALAHHELFNRFVDLSRKIDSAILAELG